MNSKSSSKHILLVGKVQSDWVHQQTTIAKTEFGWEVAHVDTADAAVQLLAKGPVDAVVASLRLPGSSGVRLLDTVKERFPGTLRFMLADPHDRGALQECLGTVHQFLFQPCGAERLFQALQRGFGFSLWLPDAEVCHLMGQSIRLPEPPEVYLQVVRALESPKTSLTEVGRIIARDPAMTARLLQLVNSAMFGLSREIVNPGEAVAFLGSEATQALVLLAHSLSWLDEKGLAVGMEPLWQHALVTSRFAREIAIREMTNPYNIEAAATGGLLHDIGKLVLASSRPKEFAALQQEAQTQTAEPPWQAEKAQLGASHAEIGGCLLAIWGLPAPVVEAVALHHTPARFLHHGFCPLAAVHAANAVAYSAKSDRWKTWLDLEYLGSLGVLSHLPIWQEACDLARTWEG